MINTKSVIQVLVNIEGINSVQVLKDKLQSAIGNVSIVRYSVTPKHAIMYVEATPTEGLATFELEVDGKEFSLINVVEDIVKDNSSYTEGSVQESFAEPKSDEPLAAMAIIFDRDPQIDYLLTKEFKLNQLSTYDGLVSISTENGLVLIEKQCNVVIDYSTYNKDTGTVRLMQKSRSEEPESRHFKIDVGDMEPEQAVEFIQKVKDNLSPSNDKSNEDSSDEELVKNIKEDAFFIDNITMDQDEYQTEIESLMIHYGIENQTLAEFIFDFRLQEEYLNLTKNSFRENEILDILMTKIRENNLEEFTELSPSNPNHPFHEQYMDFIKTENSLSLKASNQMVNLLSDLDAIENNKPYKLPERTLSLLTGHEHDIAEMQKLLDVMKVDGEETILGGSKFRLEDVDFEISSKNTYTASIPDKEETILSEEELAQFSIGDTIVETIELKVALISFGEFDRYAASHNIVGWDLFTPTTVLIKYMEGSNTPIEKIQKFHDMMNSLDTGWIDKPEQSAITSKFVSELHQVIDRDLVQEFLNRVQKHNTFVRDSTAKIRKALLDMENDYNSLKDEVNLIIDWEDLTAHASRKERTETRISGVKTPYTVANLVKVNTGLEQGDFYIPFDILNDELRSKYVLDNEEYYIEDVPSFAFYEVPVNGHVILIEKTDL